MVFNKKDDQPADESDENGNPFKEFFNGLRSVMDDSARAIARETAQTVALMMEEYQRAGLTRAEAFELIRSSVAVEPRPPHTHDPEVRT